MNIVVVLPVCKPDFHLSVKWLCWITHLQAQSDAKPFDLVIFCAASLEQDQINRLRDGARHIGASIEINPNYYERHDLGYAACANNEMRSALEMTERLYPGRPTLWCEPDCTPMRATWAQEIDAEYAACGRPFLGDFHAAGAIPHMSGNAVWSADWRKLAPSIAMLPYPRPEQGFDTQCAHETVPQMARSTRIQQIWMTPIFTEQNAAMVAPSTSLFHRCKDGSLIDVLAARLGLPPIPLELPIVAPTQILATRAGMGLLKRRGGTEILYVTCAKDMEFLRYSLQSCRKFASGFSGITLAVPEHERGQYNWTAIFGVKLHYYNEIEGRGFLQHLIKKCRADELCPEADTILHMDPDCLFWKSVTPGDYIIKGKPIVVREKYALLLNPNRRYWQKTVHAALGFWPDYEVMVRHPAVHIAEVYAATRTAVEQHNGVSFDSYVIAGKNSFPQSFCEFNALGSVAIKQFADHYTFQDYDRNKDCSECGVSPMGGHQFIYRKERDSLVETWSHGGIDKYRKLFDEILSGKAPAFYVK